MFNQYKAEESRQWYWFWQHAKSAVTRKPLAKVDDYDPTELQRSVNYHLQDDKGKTEYFTPSQRQEYPKAVGGGYVF